MELIYVYINKYRTFCEQEICLTNKFKIKFEKKNNKLSIKKNKFFSIYPSNIVNINGIFGKNASGKTSFLELIGKPVGERPNYINDEDTESYFLIYYMGDDDKGNPKFVFETPNVVEYIPSIFENDTQYSSLEYYESKKWFSGDFQEKENEFWINCRYNYSEYEEEEGVTSVILFEKDKYIQPVSFSQIFDEECNISIKKTRAPMKSLYWKDKIGFLINQMKSEENELYKNPEYVVVINFDQSYSQIIMDHKLENNILNRDRIEYKELEIQRWQKGNLIFLNRYKEYLFFSAERVLRIKKNIREYKKQLTDIYDRGIIRQEYTFEEIKKIYHGQIESLFEMMNLEKIKLEEFFECERALELFLKKNTDNQYNYKINEGEMCIYISKDSNVEILQKFCEEFIDDDVRKKLNETYSVLEGFLSVDILDMSDGENAYLALLSSINEQIVQRKDKDKFIFLFDEIERSMHPEMCRCLLDNLILFLQQYKNKEFQVIISSHSPFIAGDLLKENIICFERKEGETEVYHPQKTSFAQNIYSILKSQFFLDSFIGEYASKCIRMVMRCCEFDKIEDVVREIYTFNGWSDCDDQSCKMRTVNEVREYLENMCELVGELLIRNELYKRIISSEWMSKENKIEFYKMKIRELEEK